MAEKRISLDGIKKGDFIAYSVSTQTSSGSVTKMTAGIHNIFTATKEKGGSNAFSIIKQGQCDYDFYECPELVISIPGASELGISEVEGKILNKNQQRVGHSYTISVEDWIDNDYNDICISIIAWRKKG